MSCECGGTGWLTGDFRSWVTGNTLKDVEQVRRCGQYVRYFGESPVMRDYPGKMPVPTRGDHCPAAIQAHKAIIESALAKEQAKEQR